MKNDKQYILPLDCLKSDARKDDGSTASKGVSRTVSLALFIELEKDRKTNEIAKKFLDGYKIFK